MESQLLVPPGYDPALDAKPKSKSAKRNERKKEKRLQAAIEKGNNSEDVDVDSDEVQAIRDLGHTSKSSEILTSQMNGMTVSSKPIEMIPPVALVEGSCLVDAAQDIDKKIRALKKKIRLAEAQQQKNEAEKLKAEHLEKMRKLEGWREELKLLELKRGQQEVSS
ncbi:Partner of Y14 and mago [Linum grandiflorum]